MTVPRWKRLSVGGSGGNEQLTAVVATLLLVLLAIEGATLLDLGSLLTVHAFVGMLIVPLPVIGPPVSPDPVPTLVTVPPLLSSTSQTTEPLALMTRMDCPGGQVPVTRC